MSTDDTTDTDTTIDSDVIADSQTIRTIEDLYERQKYLRNDDLRCEILDAVDAPGNRERYNTGRNLHATFTHDHLRPIARYVGADLIVPTKQALVARVADAVGIDHDHLNQDGNGFNRAALKRLHRYTATHADSGDPSLCGQVRGLSRGSSPTEVARQSEFSRWQAKHHARGKCNCDTAVEPITKHTAITRSECVEWRRRVRHDGVDRKVIGEEEGRRRTTISKHVRGACQHDESELAESPVEAHGGDISIGVCEGLRETLAADEGATSTSLGKRDGMPAEVTIRKHARGECRHDEERVEHPPVATDGSGEVLDDGE